MAALRFSCGPLSNRPARLSKLILGFACFGLVSAYRLQQTEAVEAADTPAPPDDEEQAQEFYQCTRQCRWQFGFFDLQIVGAKRDWKIFHGWTMCQCYRLRASPKNASETPGGADVLSPMIPRFSNKQFDTVDTWSGNGTSGFDCDFVCTQDKAGQISTLETEAAKAAVAAGATFLHCGKCAACSAMHDIEVGFPSVGGASRGAFM
ncbi:hypothetical protein AK812_SmicGene19716 [Symbiodinium microadriaticum]|uniref:Uncharacterized protein n=1 Tax=Symbiodinium microadriaticum TaxID=2951 RepID=A0A1Q9DRX5_SYMMI|nr:hypothetical protein AK812_SmicGene19716 [Symbiodinium microadriaticum]